MTARHLPARSWLLALTAVAAVALFSAAPRHVQASAGTSIVVEASGAGSVGSTGTVSISVLLAPTDTLSEFDVQISFDPDIVEVEDADAVALNPRWDPPSGLPLLIDVGTPGIVRVHATTGDACPPGSSCPLFSFEWVALANGSSTLSVSGFTLTGAESGETGELSGVTSVSANVTVGAVATPSPTPSATPSPIATTTPLPSPTAGGGGTAPSPTAATAPATSSPGGPVTPAAVSTTAGATTTGPVPSALAPGSGTGLAPGDTAWLGQAALAAFVVAALLSFGWIMSTFRTPSPAHAAPAPQTPPPREGPAAPPAHVQEELRMQAVSEYLKMMEALGLASSDISTGDEGPPARG